ncbi:hypothetical protein CRENPOLYSF2_3920005 [Crenothrix polyspora]|uniref:Uncharacterized protein n=1 Tax=Crenothrix polyspora TaxID=360316 RepID=A0A1R4HDM2_9GAMM|nr:hypothetical protein CRENPOLYSF2_3920005 [Crenothrix polyspora]
MPFKKLNLFIILFKLNRYFCHITITNHLKVILQSDVKTCRIPDNWPPYFQVFTTSDLNKSCRYYIKVITIDWHRLC